MFANQSREQLRQMYCRAWKKSRAGEPLQPLEQQVARVIQDHPEYQAMLEAPEAALAAEFTPEQGAVNPFLHMGMHLAIRDQVATDRPQGIRTVFERLLPRLGPLEAEHVMMDCLGQALWEAQRFGRAPDEAGYLECLRRAAGGTSA
ncbi:DUF1841 family protein [Ectothiorhodospira lacustris]|uniref:DUF1841 family protein n=1 Tax=Ectothiorhodospira lacustris TaxID=2899127 RepID=UPI001EE94D2A|nr:DUF1841 family protein [Ectothiorhodospira lacustris]MCG5501151.1 DUF1841 family protein [Ectothiorhodospira lacustris]MCG5509529.1 DUF1841 family protein [Ectothiorhodospira lacustris]MCG5521676.1 DUF1841 family protein [Ectothiorhodospira lacustris]